MVDSAVVRVFALGCPLLDLCSVVSADFVQANKIELGRAFLVDSAETSRLLAGLDASAAPSKVPGGSGLNTCRLLQQLVNERGAAWRVAYGGCLGDDAVGETLRTACRDVGLLDLFAQDKLHATGHCAVFVNDRERALYTHLGAAAHFPPSRFAAPDCQAAFADASIAYMSSFFLSDNIDAAMALQTACLEAKKPLALNLASPFLVSAFSSRVIDAIHASTFVFGNHEEFLALATASKEPRMLAAAAAGDLASIVQWVRSLSALPGACEESGRTVVCTRGCEPTIHLEGPRDAPVIEHFDVTRIPVDEICDTNGAGDAFVAGYLAELIDGAPVAKRVQTAHAIAGRVVRHEGAVM